MAEYEELQGEAANAVCEAAALMARLRAPDGCPWDLEQTFDSIKKHTLEEVYEVFDAIERRNWSDLRDELGDLLLQVLFYAQMAQEAGYFSLRDVADTLSAKLVRRHPHIFGNAPAADTGAVLRNWEQIKRKEKGDRAEQSGSLLDDVPRSMPAALEAAKLGSKAGKAGFDWPDATGLFAKVSEELEELRSAVDNAKRDEVEGELGDLMFTTVNLARHLRIDAESALRRTNAKFRRRFADMESEAGNSSAFEALAPDAKEALWARAKAKEGAGD